MTLFSGCVCGDDLRGGLDGGGAADASTGPRDAGAADAGRVDAGSVDAGIFDAGRTDAGATDAGPFDAGPCDALLCESFEAYAAGPLGDGQQLGPWRVEVSDGGSTAAIATLSDGSKTLRVHLDQGSSAGAQLKTRAGVPLFAAARPQLYGRLRMYMSPDGTSAHWTLLGASGVVPSGTTSAGATASYRAGGYDDGSGKNAWRAAYSNSATGQECHRNSPQRMQAGGWICVSFSFDGPSMQYRLFQQGQLVTNLSVDQFGDGCADMSNQKWWGPDFSELYVGALSFSPMTGPLDVWVDDVTLDARPVSCP